MPLDNLFAQKITSQQIIEIMINLAAIERILEGSVINLTPKERQFYGRVGRKAEALIKKVKMWIKQKPEFMPFYLNLENYEQDYMTRENLRIMVAKMKTILESMDDTFILAGSDLFNASIQYYRHIKQISRANVPGTTEIYMELKETFK